MQETIDALLRKRDFERLVDLCLAERQAWRKLRASLFATDETLYWPAVEAVARVMKRHWSAGQAEKVRDHVRRLFWLINDESGGIGWNAPQTIAEIIHEIPELADPYAGMMIHRSLGEPPLVKNGLWGIGRLGKRIRATIGPFQDLILASFAGDAPEILGHAAWALGEVEFPPATPFLERLQGRTEPVRIYLEGALRAKNLGQWVEEAAAKIRAAGKE